MVRAARRTPSAQAAARGSSVTRSFAAATAAAARRTVRVPLRNSPYSPPPLPLLQQDSERPAIAAASSPVSDEVAPPPLRVRAVAVLHACVDGDTDTLTHLLLQAAATTTPVAFGSSPSEIRSPSADPLSPSSAAAVAATATARTDSVTVDDRTLANASNGGWSALHYATAAQSCPCVRMLLAHGADVNRTTSLGATALHIACAGGDVATTQMLLAAGADVSGCDQYGSTALHRAAAAGALSCALQLSLHAMPSLSLALQQQQQEQLLFVLCHQLLIPQLNNSSKNTNSSSNASCALTTPPHSLRCSPAAAAAATMVSASTASWLRTFMSGYGGRTPAEVATANGHVKTARLLKLLSASSVSTAGSEPTAATATSVASATVLSVPALAQALATAPTTITATATTTTAAVAAADVRGALTLLHFAEALRALRRYRAAGSLYGQVMQTLAIAAVGAGVVVSGGGDVTANAGATTTVTATTTTAALAVGGFSGCDATAQWGRACCAPSRGTSVCLSYACR